jgi:leucyl-tRNA synthetase
VIFGGASMSKSKGNIVEPMPLVERWGADTVRLAILFAGPFEDDIDWKAVAPDPDRRPGVTSWLGRVHAAVSEAAERDAAEPEALRRVTHRTIRGVTNDMERFRFNVAISKMQVLSNEIRAALDSGGGAREAATALVLLLAPLAPFIAEELWREELGNEASVHASAWPTFDEELAREERVTLVVQVDGKVRDRMEVSPDAGEGECRELALASEKVQRSIDGREVRKVIVRPPRLVNVVTAR